MFEPSQVFIYITGFAPFLPPMPTKVLSPLATGENQPPRKERLDAKQPRDAKHQKHPQSTL